MSNTKKYFYSIYSGVTPYFNEIEFSNQLESIGIKKDSILYNWILWKGFTFNFMLSSAIDTQISKLKKIVHISDSKIEINIIKGLQFDKEQKQFFSSTIKLPLKVVSKEKINNNERSVCSIPGVYRYLSNINDSWCLKIPDIESMELKISNEEFEKIEYIFFVDRNIVQSNRFIHENEDKLNNRDIVKNMKQLKEELSKEYSHIFNKTEMLAER